MGKDSRKKGRKRSKRGGLLPNIFSSPNEPAYPVSKSAKDGNTYIIVGPQQPSTCGNNMHPNMSSMNNNSQYDNTQGMMNSPYNNTQDMMDSPYDNTQYNSMNNSPYNSYGGKRRRT